MKRLSDCCLAPVIVGGKGSTHYYICTACDEACDIAVKPSKLERVEVAMPDRRMTVSQLEREPGRVNCR